MKTSELLFPHLRFEIFICAALSIIVSQAFAEALISEPVPPAVPPLASVYKPGVVLDIVGTAAGSGFRQYSVAWARGLSTVGTWETAGVVLAGGGTNAITNSSLAQWSTGTITQADFYTIRVVVDQVSFTDEARTYVYLEPDLYSTNWPQWLDLGPDWWTSVMAVRGSLGQPLLAIVVPERIGLPFPSRLRLFDLAGDTDTTYELDNGGSGQPAVLNYEPTGDALVVPEAFDLRVFSPDGSSTTLHPLGAPGTVNFQFPLVILPDLDADGLPEIVALGTDFDQNVSWLYAWRNDGQLFSPNYPVLVPKPAFAPPGGQSNRVMPVDADVDGIPELVVVGSHENSFSLRMLRSDGTPANWPNHLITGAFSRLASGDLDGDGRPEILVQYSDPVMFPDSKYWVAVYSANGDLASGWPKELGPGSPGAMVLADLDRDGAQEIVVTGGYPLQTLTVLRGDGTLFPGAWPITARSGNQQFGVPVVADIDADGYPEIIVTRNDTVFLSQSEYYADARLLAYRHDGTLARFWRLPSANGNRLVFPNTVTVGDFDGDGYTDLAVPYLLALGGNFSPIDEGILAVLRLSTRYRSNPRDWPMSFRDRRNSSTSLVSAKLRAAMEGNDFVLSWPVQPDPAVVQLTDSLGSPDWQPLGAIPVLTHGINRVSLPSTQSQRWYRLRYE